MSLLRGKKILLGISGGIAAYKIPSLIRLFTKADAEVRVVLTPSATDFVAPLTLSTLSKHPVLSTFSDHDGDHPVWNNHVELALWADLMIIAPATANTLSKMASATCDNLLLACYLSAKCPVFFAPAMDLDMHKHPATQKTFETLTAFGNIMIPSTSGPLASGLEGEGRMEEPENIFEFLHQYFESKAPLKGKKVVVTAGPTYEPIDPVRFIGNHSSGKMGYAIADTAASLGAEVTLISGPTHLKTRSEKVNCIPVKTAEEMCQASLSNFNDADLFVMSAAVSDYKVANVASKKMKKNDLGLAVALVPTTDVLATLGSQKKDQILVGFALETDHEIQNAIDKLKRKNLDAIVLNSLNDSGAGFGVDTNKITFIDKAHNILPFELKSKEAVALDILNQLIPML